MPSDPAIDLALFQALRAGDDTALNRLIARWEQPLFSFAFRYVQNTAEARDLASEAFVRLYQQRARLRPDTRVPAWLFTALANLCRNHLRWKHRHPAIALDAGEAGKPAPADSLPSDQPPPDDAMQQTEITSVVWQAVAALPHELKTTVLLHHYQHLSCREIAQIMHCTESGAESRLYRARQRLRRALADFLPEISPR